MWMTVWYFNLVWKRLKPCRLATSLFKSLPLHLFEDLKLGVIALVKWKHNTDNEDDLWYPFMIHNLFSDKRIQRPLKPRLMTDPNATTDFSSIFVSIFSFLFKPLWAGKREVTLAILRAGRQADWLGVNHHFVSLRLACYVGEASDGPDSRGDRREDNTLDS